MNTLYRVIAKTSDSLKHSAVREVSTGFGSREAAERFAAGGSASGRFVSVDIQPYESDETNETDEDE